MMSEQDPKQFLREVLSLPSGSLEPSPPPNSRVGGDPHHRMPRGGPKAKADSLRFLKQHTLPHRHLYAVTFEDEAGLAWDCFCFLEQDERGFWHGGVVSGVVKEIARRSMRQAPWVQLVGGGGEESLWAGGYVTEKASDAYIVRLIGKTGLVLEDTVQDGIVLFQADQHVELPMQAEIYTRSGELLGVQSFLDYASYGTV
ncbi:MAG: hypothetical protein ACYDER_24280 [Ktedonobacteraceae bacterium]